MPSPNSPIRLGSKVRVSNVGTGKVNQILAEGKVIEVELDKGGFVTASKDAVKRIEAPEVSE